MADSVYDAAPPALSAPPAPPEAHESEPEQVQVSTLPPESTVESTLASESESAPYSATAEAIDPTALAQRLAESDALAQQGVQLCRKARWRDAIDPLKRATELNPAHRSAHYYLGDAFNHTDQLAAALEAFEAAAKVDSENWRALKGVGIVLDRMRRPEDASVAYQRAREVQQGHDQDQDGSES